MYFDMYPYVFFHKELIIRAQENQQTPNRKKKRGARVVLGGPIRPKVWLKLKVTLPETNIPKNCGFQ